ncbi:MAG: acyl-CoA synthetase [Betaproteobacteria bacterium]|nr:acyl-CoA synthetase [Betaproteobacteria bacterium]
MRGPIYTGLESGQRDISLDATTRKPGLDKRSRPDWVVRPERSNKFALRFIVWVALTLGRPAARLLLYPACLYFLIFSPASHAASTGYLRKALGREPGRADSFRHCHTFAATLLDRVFLFNDQYARFDVRVHGEDILFEMTAREEGCFLLGAHMGSFEIIRALGRRNTAARISLVMYEENARKFNAALAAINPALSMQIISLGKIDSMLKVETALKRGEIVGMLGDRTFQGEGTIACDFFGEKAHFPSGPFRLAAMLKRPIVLMFGLYRGGNRYDIYFERLVNAWPAPRAERNTLFEQAQRGYAARLEHYCRDAPYNWYNFYDFWR